jgi:hypothetical protein
MLLLPPSYRSLSLQSGLKISGIVLATVLSTLACQQTTGGLQAPAQFTWRGWVYDSVTAAPVDDFRVAVREQAEHDSLGWKPGGIPEYFPGGRFAFTYVLWGFRCEKPVDTTVTIHLDFSDPSRQYQPATHATSWLFNCDNQPPPAQAPPAIEDSVRVLLIR